MEMNRVAPAWARWLILPAIVFCILCGLGGILEGLFFDHFQSGLARFALVMGGFFLLHAAWNARWLFRFRDAKACLSGGFLHCSRGSGSPASVVPIEEIRVGYSSLFQLVHIDRAPTGERLLTIDRAHRQP